MAISFNSAKTSVSRSVARFKFEAGDNAFRVVSDILPMYRYWIKNTDGTEVPFECLSFDRNTQEFTKAYDPVAARFPELRPKWSYVVQVLNRKTNKVEVMELKKAMLSDMVDVAQQLEVDPKDLDSGIEWIVERVKTGPKVFNVEYRVKQLKAKSLPASADDREVIASAGSIEEDFPRETVAKQEERLDRAQGIESSTNTDKEAAADLAD